MTNSTSTAFSRRTLLSGSAAVLSSAALSATVLGGCSTAKQPIRLLAGGGRWEKGGYGWNQVQKFNEQHPDTPVEVISAGQNFTKLFTQQVSSGSFPDMTLGSVDLATVRQRDWVVPIADLGVDIKPRYPKEMWVDGITTAEGKIWTWGQDDGRGLFFGTNTAFLADAGGSEPPGSWDEMIDLSTKVHAKHKDVYGIALPLLNGEAITYLANSLLRDHPGLQGGFDLRAGRYAMDRFYTGAMELLVELQQAGAIHPNSSQLSFADVDGYFNSGKSAFNLDGAWICSVAKERDFSDYTVSVAPRRTADQKSLMYGSLSASSFFVYKQSKSLDKMGPLVDFLTGEEYVKGQLVTNHSMTANPELNRRFAPSEQIRQLLEVQDQVVQPPIPQADATAMDAKKKESALPAPRQAAADLANGVLAGKITDWKGALKQMNTEYNARFDQALADAKCPREKFVFADWDGVTNVQLTTSV